MGMSGFSGEGDDRESLATINDFLDAGGSLLDTADMSRPFTNEKLVGKAIAAAWAGISGKPEYLGSACPLSHLSSH